MSTRRHAIQALMLTTGSAWGLAPLAARAEQAGQAHQAAQATQPPVLDVAIREYRFEPATATVAPGTTVRWTNHEKRTTHTVLFETLTPPEESDRLFPGEVYERRFDAPGRYPYRCGPHPEMKGVVEVRGA